MKIFVSDLDGTLIDDAIKSDEAVGQCVENVLKTKNEFVVATGRTHYGVRCLNFYKQPIYFIIMNGAIILDRDKKVIYKQTIEPKVVDMFLENFSNDNVEYITEEKTCVTLSREEYINRYSQWDIWRKKMLQSKDPEHMEYMLSHFEFNADIQKIKNQVVKINILELDPQKYSVKEKKISSCKSIKNNPFAQGIFEITAKDISKRTAVLKLIEMSYWNSEDMFVFGDGDNDSDMLAHFKHSYAPSNASKKAKESANYILGPCSKASVIKEIRSLI